MTFKSSPNVTRAMNALRTAVQKQAEISTSRVPKNPVIDDELKDILLEYMIDQIKKGKIKVVEDID